MNRRSFLQRIIAVGTGLVVSNLNRDSNIGVKYAEHTGGSLDKEDCKICRTMKIKAYTLHFMLIADA